MSEIKWCPRCSMFLPTSDFSRSPSRRGDGLASYCRRCQTDYTREWRRKNPPK